MVLAWFKSCDIEKVCQFKGLIIGKGVRMKKWMVFLTVLVMVSLANAGLITNGSFEINSGNGSEPNGWNKDFNCYGAYNGAFVSGSWCLHPGDGGPPGGCYQDVNTVTGKWYQVSLWIQNYGGFPGSGNVKVLVGNPGTDTYTFENGTDTTNKYSLTGLVDKNFTSGIPWAQVSSAFQALGTTTRIGVYNAPFSGNFSTNVDDVNVVEVDAVVIITDPVDDVADPNATFTVEAAAAESYQWYKVGTPDVALSDGGPYSGTQTDTLTVADATLAEEGQYYCVVSNSVPTQATSASAQLWTKRLMGHWKFNNNMLDSVTESVADAPTHDGAITVNSTVIGLDFGGGSDNNFNNIVEIGDSNIPAGSVIDTGGVLVPAVAVTISGITWSNSDGTDNGGLPYPFDYSNVDDWMGSSDAAPVYVTFSGLDDSKTYDFMVHAGWAGADNHEIEVSSSDGKVSNVIDTRPEGAPNIGTITGASPTGGILQFTVVTANVSITVINAAALIMPTASVSDSYATGIDGNAIKFNNENAFVEIADSNFFNFYPHGFTSSVWYKADAAVGWRLPFSKVSLYPRGGWLFGIDDTVSNEVSLIIEAGGAWITSGPDVDYGDGQWHMMTATYEPTDTTLRLYSDGDYVSQALVDIAPLPLAVEPLSIGGRFGEHAVSGSIDDAKVYSYPLTAVEVAELYTNFKPSESVCVGETDVIFERLDLNEDCRINLNDFAVIAERWLDCMLIPASACD